jgi:two-component system, cell cycle sensor histidine kinase and response regulator CckA
LLAAAKTALSRLPLRVLLVGEKEEDFFLMRDILNGARTNFATELDHAHSLEEAEAMLHERPYGLILFEHATGDPQVVNFLSKFLHGGRSIPYIVLTEDANEHTVADAIGAKTWSCLTKSQLDGATLIRTIQSTLELHGLEQGQHAAEESLRKLSQAVEQSPDMVMVTAQNGTIEYVNPAFEQLSGYTREEVLGKTPRILKSGEQGQEVYQEVWRTILRGNVYRGILVNRKKNGELYHVEQSISPVRDGQGKITHFIATGRDLTERVRLEAQLIQAQKMNAIGRLAGGVAHDFNNLLTIITSYSEMALDEIEPGTPLSNKIQEVLLAARRAAELTRQLLAFSRKQPRSLRIADLNEVIGSIAKTLPRLIGEDIEFNFAPGQGLGRARVDSVQIEQILMNLASNARDAMPQGGQFRIETSNVVLDDSYVTSKRIDIPVGRYALVSVSDNGEGIAPEHLPHIFEPFYTTKVSGQGTGLGLATVYGIVKQNKGFIWVYSEVQKGTVFKIYLPCVGEKSSARESEVGVEPVARGTETILVVEDEPAVRHASTEFLRLQGYHVLEAADGLDALAVTKRHTAPIHLVLTDVVMPNMSGGELAEQIRHLRPGINLLFVSGYAGRTVLDHKVFDVENNFLQKPYTLKELAAKIRDVLRMSSSSSSPSRDMTSTATNSPRN